MSEHQNNRKLPVLTDNKNVTRWRIPRAPDLSCKQIRSAHTAKWTHRVQTTTARTTRCHLKIKSALYRTSVAVVYFAHLPKWYLWATTCWLIPAGLRPFLRRRPAGRRMCTAPHAQQKAVGKLLSGVTFEYCSLHKHRHSPLMISRTVLHASPLLCKTEAIPLADSQIRGTPPYISSEAFLLWWMIKCQSLLLHAYLLEFHTRLLEKSYKTM